MAVHQIIDQIAYHSQNNTQKRKALKKLRRRFPFLFLPRKIILPDLTGHLLFFQLPHKIPLYISIGNFRRKT